MARERQEQIRFRSLTEKINEVLSLLNIEPIRIALFNEKKETITLCNVQDKILKIKIQWVNSISRYKVETNMGINGLFFNEKLIEIFDYFIKHCKKQV